MDIPILQTKKNSSRLNMSAKSQMVPFDLKRQKKKKTYKSIFVCCVCNRRPIIEKLKRISSKSEHIQGNSRYVTLFTTTYITCIRMIAKRDLFSSVQRTYTNKSFHRKKKRQRQADMFFVRVLVCSASRFFPSPIYSDI